MKKKLKIIALLIVIIISVFCLFGFSTSDGNDEIYLCGFPAGFEVTSRGVTIIKTTDVVTKDGVYSPSKDKLLVGDRILKINDVEVNSAEDVENGLSAVNEGEVILTVMRNGEKILKSVTPAKDLNGKMRLGLMLKDGTSGIGTMTFIRKDGTFMALGHPICNENGEILEVSAGKIFRCSLFGVNKAQYGKAGELKGIIIGDEPIGEINSNHEQGIVGKMNSDFDIKNLPLIKIGEGKIGKATVVTCVDGMIPKEYDISIVKADNQKSTKNYVVKVTDKELLAAAGGIVQGMSGSPILQDGKIVGCLTHVFIGDSARGYGIAIDKMLDAID